MVILNILAHPEVTLQVLFVLSAITEQTCQIFGLLLIIYIIPATESLELGTKPFEQGKAIVITQLLFEGIL